VILPYHITFDKGREEKLGSRKIGTTPAGSDTCTRTRWPGSASGSATSCGRRFSRRSSGEHWG
jgi:hypothetical protein